MSTETEQNLLPRPDRDDGNVSDSFTIEWHLYHRQNFLDHLRKGDVIYYRPESASGGIGRRVTFLGKCADSQSKCLVQEAQQAVVGDYCGSRMTSTVKRKRLLPVFESSSATTTILVVHETLAYRQMAESQLSMSPVSLPPQPSSTTTSTKITQQRREEHVLEIGCSTGETSYLFWRQQISQCAAATIATERVPTAHASAVSPSYSSSWVGFDTGLDMVEATKRRLFHFYYPYKNSIKETSVATKQNSTHRSQINEPGLLDGDQPFPPCTLCVQVDALKNPAAAVEAATTFGSSPTVVFVDIGGCRELEGVLRMIEWILRSFETSPPRLIVVKSEQVYLAMRKECNSIGKNGVIDDGQAWFDKGIQKAHLKCLPKHPLQAHKQWSPEGRQQRLVCRYHNYHPLGCARHQDDQSCPHDHEHCHWCLKVGHTALQCPLLQQP